MYGCSKDCLILIPFGLPQISCFTLSLKCFSSDSDNCPEVRVGPLLQFPYQPRASPVLLTLLFLPLVPSSYWVFVVLYILFCWSGPLVCSQLPFCMHFCVWRCIPDASMREMCSTSSCTILLSPTSESCSNSPCWLAMLDLSVHNGKSSPLFPSQLLHPEKHRSFQVMFFLRYMPRSEIAGIYGSSI